MPIELHAFDTPNGRKISVALEEMALPFRAPWMSPADPICGAVIHDPVCSVRTVAGGRRAHAFSQAPLACSPRV